MVCQCQKPFLNFTLKETKKITVLNVYLPLNLLLLVDLVFSVMPHLLRCLQCTNKLFIYTVAPKKYNVFQ